VNPLKPKKICKGKNPVPHTNMKTGQFYWTEKPCTMPCYKNTDYCFFHQDYTKRYWLKAVLEHNKKEVKQWPKWLKSAAKIKL